MDVSEKDYAMNPQQKDEAGGDLLRLREHRRDRPKVAHLAESGPQVGPPL